MTLAAAALAARGRQTVATEPSIGSISPSLSLREDEAFCDIGSCCHWALVHRQVHRDVRF